MVLVRYIRYNILILIQRKYNGGIPNIEDIEEMKREDVTKTRSIRLMNDIDEAVSNFAYDNIMSVNAAINMLLRMKLEEMGKINEKKANS